ncbi:MAG: carbohydrate ABC transporter permease [Salinispira sp.]
MAIASAKSAKSRPAKISRRVNAISVHSNVFLNIFIGAFALLCLIPFLLVASVSFSSEDSIKNFGYRFIPSEWSTASYDYIFEAGQQIGRSYFVSISMTTIGTCLSVFVMLLCAYALSRPEFRFRRQISFIVLITLLFNAGLIPFYMVVTQLFFLGDTFLVLVLATLINPFNVIVLRSFLAFNIPTGIIESGRIEGANEFQILFKLVVPIAKPSIATIAFFTMLDYWNNWYTALLFIRSPKWTPLPNLLINIEQNIDFLVRNSGTIGGTRLFELIQQLPTQTIIFATLLITTGPVLIAFPLFQRYFVRGLTVGSIRA